MSLNEQFGGKGAGLHWLVQNEDLGFKVPEYDVVDTSYYDDFLRQQELAKLASVLHTISTGQSAVGSFQVPQSLEDKCAELAQRFKGRDLMIRSSGVISEDSDQHSGAGIYDSFQLRADELTPHTLLNTVLRVYASVNNERAVAYRNEFGLGNEKMAVVVQELMNGFNGVAMSRLPARSGIIPVTWSDLRGAVASGDINAVKHTMYFTPCDWTEVMKWSVQTVFQSDTDIPYGTADYMNETFVQLVLQLRERYGKEFELEFVKHPKENTLYLVQIRPLTNIQDREIQFPDKEPIFIGELCMGIGEYIGHWIKPSDITSDWKEPSHYVLVSSVFEKSMAAIYEQGSLVASFTNSQYEDIDKLTPNKRAIILTHQSLPGMHAMTVANEKEIICIAGGNSPDASEFKDKHGYDLRTAARYSGGVSFVVPPKFDVPLEEIGEYIHVVSNGLQGRVYRATKEEADAFARTLASQISYEVTPIEDRFGDERFWNWEFRVTPSDPTISYTTICEDFVAYMSQKLGDGIISQSTPARNSFDLLHPKAEYEVGSAFFSPNDKERGIHFDSGRSPEQITTKDQMRQWFQEFVDLVQSPNYVPGMLTK